MPAHDHLYVHIPFCDGKCDYCALYSTAYTPARADRFLEALDAEFTAWTARGHRLAPRTLYIGGGTPSVLDRARWSRLFNLLSAHTDRRWLSEWTVEINPGTLEATLPDRLAAAGVTRVSLGAQSFDDTVLRAIGRRHSARDVAVAVEALRAAGLANYGLDLIAGLPGLSPGGWRRTLNAALALAPVHVSVYGLSIEPGTRLAERTKQTTPDLAGEDEQLEAIAVAAAMLDGAGLHRYETSNYARPGFECEHNLACWQGEDYLGFGPAAASRAGRQRWTHPADLSRYEEQASRGTLHAHTREQVDRDTDLTERLAFGFRLTEGIALRRFARRHAVPEALLREWETVLRRLARQGLAEPRNRRWRLTTRGADFADLVAAELLETAAREPYRNSANSFSGEVRKSVMGISADSRS